MFLSHQLKSEKAVIVSVIVSVIVISILARKNTFVNYLLAIDNKARKMYPIDVIVDGNDNIDFSPKFLFL